MAEGYVASASIHLDALRAECLPGLSGMTKEDGVHILDPRTKGNMRYVPKLVY